MSIKKMYVELLCTATCNFRKGENMSSFIEKYIFIM
jgi:hypothetical protein